MLPDTELVWSTIKLLFAEQSVNLRTRYTINILEFTVYHSIANGG